MLLSHNGRMSGTSGNAGQGHSARESYHPLVIVLAAVCAGIAVDRWADAPMTVWLAVGGVGWAVWITLWRRGFDRAASVVLLAAVAAGGGAWHHLRWSVFPRDHIAWYASYDRQPVCIEAVALGSPRRVPAPPWDPMRIIPTGDRSRLDVRATAIRDGDRWLAVTGKVGLSVEGHLLGVKAGEPTKPIMPPTMISPNPELLPLRPPGNGAGKSMEPSTCPIGTIAKSPLA